MNTLQNMLLMYWSLLHSPLILSLLAVAAMVWVGQWYLEKKSRSQRG